MARTLIAPDGWALDPSDPSVGIFEEGWIHDVCPSTDEDLEYAEVTERHRRFEGSGFNRVAVTIVTLRCPCCGESTSFDRSDYVGA